jgi:signal transduction histidine kinase
LAMARDQAYEIDKARHEGFAGLSHELRTPLNAIIGFGQAIEEELWGAIGNLKYRDYAHNIVHAGRHLEILIQEAMDLSRLESGRIVLDEREVDLAELIGDCETLVAERALAKGSACTRICRPVRSGCIVIRPSSVRSSSTF